MPQHFYERSPQEVRLPPSPPITIHDGGSSPLKEAPVEGTAFVRPYANASRNGRVPSTGPSSALHTRWRTAVYPQFAPAFVLAAEDRVLLFGADSWLLLDAAGKLLKEDRHGDGEMVLDPRPRLFYFADTTGRIAAHHLQTGEKAFSLSVYFGDRFRRSFIDRSGRRMVVASVERPSNPHGDDDPSLSVIEVQELTEPVSFSQTGRLKSAQRLRSLMRDSARLLTAARDGMIALATDQRLYLAGADLTLRTELAGEFEPLWLSLDEGSRAYMIVGGPALWVVTATGERVVHAPLPQGFQAVAPPIVGYDHTIYLAGHDRLLAISSSGKTLWEQAVAPVGGAVVTTGHRLLVSSGPELLSFDGKGQRTSLFRAEESLTTPPAVTARGEVIVAGQEFVYCLTQ